MSDQVKHECGVVLIRLLKPLDYYREKYGTWRYGLNKLYLLMQKQHNRGQDGAGVVNLKIDQPAGKKYLFRERSNLSNPIQDVFSRIFKHFQYDDDHNHEQFCDSVWAKENLPFAGELYLGHLRYGTFGNDSLDYVHPVMRENNWRSRNLVLAGNFNLTNVDEIYNALVELGQHPKDYTDTVSILENVGHFLDEENQLLFRQFKNEGYSNREISSFIERDLDVRKILERSSKKWDGGYVLAGLLGHGDAFVARDPWGIRPASYYYNDEIVVVASERPVIQTALDVRANEVQELKPGYALIIKKDGQIKEEMVSVPQARKSCSFERIYFSRGSDKSIYLERKELGRLLAPLILNKVNHNLEDTVFSYIPNTAETAFYGMMEGIREYLVKWRLDEVRKLGVNPDTAKMEEILSREPRVEKIAVKDVKLRTFITADSSRDDMVAHVYDVTYGIVRNKVDTLVVIDDSIVRGTTLKQSILKILDRLHPKKIIIVSSAPQIRYPDCYGIDMARLADFCAFRAAIELLKDNGLESTITEVYEKCKSQMNLPKEEMVNYVKDIYRPFTDEQISDKVAEMLRPIDIDADVEVLFQSVENLNKACPNDLGDWYFTGNYPTPGGNKVVNSAFINYVEGNSARAYQSCC
ncbi:amidophosphoribosyltransferase [Alkalitalea saponilacus]|uniref:Amidophosphoribosyltransferase n=1 Tax=Alkalitalea saponilacus TaxID=889453 RepID=A0A1T5HQW2_9BACT|nr:amidophosphoribosyltransferase [Alkalitalea saponilacus]ASB48405.1 amidophosphoribosyltransferase [Alkalitalea saponilacus]SKC23058.1 amidophosphoribosyltransferase [Alkalitalea saponilacus]